MVDHSFRQANISLLVFVACLAIGQVIIGSGSSDRAKQAVAVVAFVVAFTTLFWQYHREDVARERQERQPGT